MNDTTIFTLESKNPGPTVGIFGGVHGDELAGIKTIDYLLHNLELLRGKVFVVYANPRAIEKGVRYTEKNLNRCFLADSYNGDSYEEQRAVELMNILDQCDALLDLHAYNEPRAEAQPFAICEPNAYDIVSGFNMGIVVSNIDAMQKGGTDGYMYNAGKIGICAELGAIEQPEKYIDLGIETAQLFLQHFEMIEPVVSRHVVKQTILECIEMYRRETDDFYFSRPYVGFENITKNDVICTDGTQNRIAGEDARILFPHDDLPIGVEAYILARELS